MAMYCLKMSSSESVVCAPSFSMTRVIPGAITYALTTGEIGGFEPRNVNVVERGPAWSGEFKPFEVKTLRVNAKTDEVSEVNALEE